MKRNFLWILISMGLCHLAYAGGGVIQGDGTPTHNEEQELIHDLPALNEVKKLILDLRPQYLLLSERFLFLLEKMSSGHVPMVHIKKTTPDQYAGYEAEYSSGMGHRFLISNLSYYFWDSFFTLPVQDSGHPERMSQVKVILHEMIHALLSFPELKTQRLTEYIYMAALGQGSEELISQLDVELESESHGLEGENPNAQLKSWIKSWEQLQVERVNYPLIPASLFDLYQRALPGSRKKVEENLTELFSNPPNGLFVWPELFTLAGRVANQRELTQTKKIEIGFGSRVLKSLGVTNNGPSDLCLQSLKRAKQSAQHFGMGLRLDVDRSWWGSKLTIKPSWIWFLRRPLSSELKSQCWIPVAEFIKVLGDDFERAKRVLENYSMIPLELAAPKIVRLSIRWPTTGAYELMDFVRDFIDPVPFTLRPEILRLEKQNSIGEELPQEWEAALREKCGIQASEAISTHTSIRSVERGFQVQLGDCAFDYPGPGGFQNVYDVPSGDLEILLGNP